MVIDSGNRHVRLGWDHDSAMVIDSGNRHVRVHWVMVRRNPQECRHHSMHPHSRKQDMVGQWQGHLQRHRTLNVQLAVDARVWERAGVAAHGVNADGRVGKRDALSFRFIPQAHIPARTCWGVSVGVQQLI